MVFKSVGKAAAAAAPSIGPRSLSGDDRYAQIIIPPIERNLKRHSRQQRQKKKGRWGRRREKPNLFRIPHLSLLRCLLRAYLILAAAVRPTDRHE